VLLRFSRLGGILGGNLPVAPAPTTARRGSTRRIAGFSLSPVMLIWARIMNRLPGFSVIATVNTARASSSVRQIASVF
jgi:hypothetical protein